MDKHSLLQIDAIKLAFVIGGRLWLIKLIKHCLYVPVVSGCLSDIYSGKLLV